MQSGVAFISSVDEEVLAACSTVVSVSVSVTLTNAGKNPTLQLWRHYITLHYITLHYITLHYITLHYITLHYITLHYITLHYITAIQTRRRDVNRTIQQCTVTKLCVVTRVVNDLFPKFITVRTKYRHLA